MDQEKIKDEYKYVVVGGGIVGAGILRELILHQQDVLLLERGDFSSQTSQGSSKMLHGGIRYLENFDFMLVHEALKEKKLWLKLAPHIAKECQFYLPVYRHSKWPLFFLRIGLFLYDLLSNFKNAPYKILSRNEVLAGLPGLQDSELKGGGLYSDGIIDDSKLTLDLLFDARSRGANILNYHELIEQVEENKKFILTIKNHLSQTTKKIKCQYLIFAIGPFTDQVMHKLKIPWQDIILPSKGTHLWIKKDSLQIKDAMVLQTKDNRIIFVIPQRNSILVGTTEVPLHKDDEIFNIQPSEEEINYLLENLNNYFPTASLDRSCILSSYAAVRPLVKRNPSQSSEKISRKHKIFCPQENILVIAGGKYTTFRVMASDLCRKLFKKENIPYDRKLSLTPLEYKSPIYNIHEQLPTLSKLNEVIQNEMPANMEDLIKRRLSLDSLSQLDAPEKLIKMLDQVQFTNDKKDQN